MKRGTQHQITTTSLTCFITRGCHVWQLKQFLFAHFFIRLTQRILVSLIIVQNLAHSLINPVIKSYRSNYLWSQRKRHRYRPPYSHDNLWLIQLLKKRGRTSTHFYNDLYYLYVLTSEPHISISLWENAFPINTMKVKKKFVSDKQANRVTLKYYVICMYMYVIY